jgi:hypothetical protein
MVAGMTVRVAGGGEAASSWILASGEPAARWIVHAHLVEGTGQDRLAEAEHALVLGDPATAGLIDRLPDCVATIHGSPEPCAR